MRTFNLVKSLSTLVNNITSLPFREGLGLGSLRLLILCLSLATLGVESVWGAWSGSGQGTQVNDVWYALYDDTERSFSIAWGGDNYNYSLLAPGSSVSFQAKRSSSVAVGKLYLDELNSSGDKISNLWGKNPSTSYENSGVLPININTHKLNFNGSGGDGKRYFRYVHVPMATYFEDPSKSELDFGSGAINTGSVSQDFTIAWCNTGTITSSLSAHSDVYTISISDNASAGHYGTATVTVTYNRNIKAGTHDATLTLTSGSTTKTITLTGTTTKLDPSITWSSEDATFNVDDVLSATNGAGLTVTLSSTGNEQYVNCSGNTATMLEATTGTITITANVTGNDIYNSKSFTKDITITNKEKQYITWNQDFSKLKTTDANKTIILNAKAVNKDGNETGLSVSYELVGDKTGLSLSQNGNTWTLTYSASACKNTTIVAKQEGNATYAPASNYSLPVKVIDPTQTCSTEETLINSDVKLENTSTYYNIDIPSSMTIDVRRSKTGIFDVYLQGFDVELYSGANAAGTQLSKESYSASDINNSKTIVLSNLNINAKSVKLISHANNGYTVSSLSYTHYKYCNTDKTALNYNTYPNTTTDAQTFTISYANYPIEIECSTNKLQIDKSSFGDCGVAGSETISVTYTTGVNTGKETEYIYVKDNTGAILQTITVTVSIQKVSQNITSTTIASSYKTTDKIELSATSNSGLTYFEYSCSPADVATFDGNIMTFNKSCANLSITVTQPGDNVYSPCSTTINNIVVSKVTPTIVVAPTTTAITYGQKLSESSLASGAVKVNPFRGEAVDHSVTGSFAWTNGEYTIVEAGGTHEYDVTFTPSGIEAEMYNTVSGKATVTINKATPTLTAKNEEDLEVYVNDTQTPKLNLVDYITSYSAEDDAHGHKPGMSAITYTCDKPSTGIVTNDKKFYATAPGTYTITATAPATGYYNSQTTTFTIKAYNYYYSRAYTEVVVNAQTGKDGGWVSVWQNDKPIGDIKDEQWLHSDQTSANKRIRTSQSVDYYYRAKIHEGYTFDGWFTTTDAVSPVSTALSFNEAVTNITSRDNNAPTWVNRYAKFTPITYIVKFVGNGHSGGSMSDQTFTYDVAQNLATNGFTRTGWSFTGWKDGDGNTYTNEQSVTNLASSQGAVVTMTAQWNQDVYTVTLDPATYGTGGTAQISVKYNELIPTSITPPTPIDPAYIFLGYYLDVADENTQYYNADGTAVSGKKWMFTEGKTLTAKWKTGDYIKSWDVAESYTAQSNIPYDIAKSFSGAPVTYSIEGTDEGVITINNTNKYIYANKKGKVTIKACPISSEGYSSISCDTHEITVVGKEQKISWSQSFTFTTQSDGSIDETVALTAKAIDATTESETGNPIWYSVGDANMVEIIGDATIGYSLHVKARGTGSTTITAHVDGTEVYESGELEFTIRIYKYGDKCHVNVMTYPDEKEVGNVHSDLTISSDKFTGAPTDSLYIQIKREGTTYGEMQIYAENSSTQVFGQSFKREDVPTSYKTFGFALSAEDVNKVMIASKSAVKYTVKDIRVTQKSYLRTNLTKEEQYYPINVGIFVNEYYKKQFTISYSAKHQVMWQITNTSKKNDWNLQIVGHTKRNQSTTDYTNDCDDWGTYTFELVTTHVWLTQEDIKDTITIKTSDGNDAIIIPINLTVGLGALYQFDGRVDNNWSNVANWHKEGSTDPVQTPPDMRNKVEIWAPIRITEPVTVYGLTIKENTATKGSVTIAPTGGLTVYNGGVTNLDESLTIESSQENQGFFRMSPDANALMTPMPIATTQLATRSTLDEGANDDAVWQYIGIPSKTYDPSTKTTKDGLEFTVDYITWLYEWSEPDGWIDMKNVPQPVMLKPFTGYAITQYGMPTYEFTGQLFNNDVRIPLTYTDEPGMVGDNVIANSYTSPIDVSLVEASDFEGSVIQAFYVFNSGSYNQWKEANEDGDSRGIQTGSLKNYSPGQYIAIPTKSGAELGENELTMIAPMQGFDIYTTEKGKTAYFNLNYRKHVWNATNVSGQMNEPLRAPKADDTYMSDDVARQYAVWDSINVAKQARIDAITHRVRLIAYGENSGNDRVVIIESPLYAKQYENGADAPKKFAETDGLLGLYANEQDCGLMSVNATNSVDGMFVGFRAGSDSEYELSASNVIGQPLRLLDLQTQQMIDLKDSATYTFTAEPNSQDDFRFQIINQDIHVNPTGWTGLGDKAKIWYNKQTLYISDAAANSTAAIYTAAGELLEQVRFNHNTTISTTDIPEGVYMVRVEDSVLKFFVKH